MSLRTAPTPLADILEKDWQRQVVSLARQLGWDAIYHTYRSTRSDAGFPDLVMVRDRVLLLELKRESGTLSTAQRDWLGKLLDAGAEAYVARPRDLQALAVVLQGRQVLADTALAVSTAAELKRARGPG